MAVDLPTPPSQAAATEASALGLPRLVEQLQTLSRITETLTVRLLELEERLEDQEARLLPLIAAAQAVETAVMEGVDQRLGETEERLARVESILRGVDRPLRAVPRGAARAIGNNDAFLGDGDPFPEEGEQPFLDEQIA